MLQQIFFLQQVNCSQTVISWLGPCVPYTVKKYIFLTDDKIESSLTLGQGDGQNWEGLDVDW